MAEQNEKAACAESERLATDAHHDADAIVDETVNEQEAATSTSNDAVDDQRSRIDALITELQQRSRALEEANLELRRVSRYRSLFLGRMSHELRTPLTSILGFAEILLDHETLTDTQRGFCQKIQSSGKQLHVSLNHLVDLSRIEAGRMDLFFHEFSLRATLRDSCAAVARLAQKQGVEIEFFAADDLGTIVSDEGKLRQVLYNFLAYAISRSPHGEGVQLRAQLESAGCFVVEICDAGEPLRNAEHLFEPVTFDASKGHATEMDELGVVIGHKLVGVLGGVITLETRVGTGLIVRLEFPSRPPDPEAGR